MIIRRAQKEDIPAITEIYNQAIASRDATCDLEAKTIEDRLNWFQQFNDQYPIYIGLEKNTVVCYGCLFKYSPKEGYRHAVENSLYVHHNHRRQGHGKVMLSFLISQAKDLGFHYMEARIFEHNPASLNLHQKAGFTLVGIQKEIANLDGFWRNNVILMRHL